MASPKGQPTALRKLHGDTSKGKKPINEREPKVKVGAPPVPSDLRDAVAVAKFKKTCKDLEGYGILATIEGDVLAIFSNTWSEYVEAMTLVKLDGLVYEAPNKTRYANPAVSIAAQCRRDLLKILDSFGLTPAARTKIISLNENEDDLLAEFIRPSLN